MTTQSQVELVAAQLEKLLTAHLKPQKLEPAAKVGSGHLKPQKLEDKESTTEDESSSDDDDEGTGSSKQSRSEKKVRKAMLQLGMTPVHGVSHVSMKKRTNITIGIANPDVFKSPDSDTYVIFGDAKIDDLISSKLQTQAAEVSEDDDEVVDEDGLEERDIELVMTQAGVTRRKAVKTLKAADGDIVTAIMDLTTN